MKNILNQLIQLQELNFALAEQKASNPNARLKQLEEAIVQLAQKLPEGIADRYQRLQKRFPLAVIPVIRNACSGCALVVPLALVNDAKAGRGIQSCPHCGRFLYHLESAPRRLQKPTNGKGAPEVAGIARFSAVELMAPKLAAKTRDEAIAELAGLLATEKFVEEPTSLVELALRREAMVSTGVEHGLAFPHVRNIEGGSLTFALGLKKSGLDFGSTDEHLTKIIFLIVIPTAASAFYLRLLAGLVGALSTADARNALLDCDTPESMWKNLNKLTRGTIP
jgi:mannitol/fructose-specific phosphotransferase system IIA component (Ntr-type)